MDSSVPLEMETVSQRPIMNPEPLVSVIIPVYRRKELILRALGSLCASSYRNLEILVMDDGSHDGTLEAVQKAAASDSRIRGTALEHRGISASRNAGLDLARGEYLFFMDSDDLIHPDLIKAEAEVLASGQADAIMSAMWELKKWPGAWHDDSSPRISLMDCEQARWSFFMEHRHFTMVNSMLIRRECVGNDRFDEDLNYGEDTLFVYRIIRRGHKWGFLENRWYAYIEMDDSLSRNPTEIGRYSAITFPERIFVLERADGPTLGSRVIYNWMSYYLFMNEVEDIRNPQRREDIRTWIRGKKEQGLYGEIPWKSRVMLSIAFLHPLLQKTFWAIFMFKHNLENRIKRK